MTATRASKLDEIVSLIKENTPKAKVKASRFECLRVECSTKDSDDVVIQLDREGFNVRKRHPAIKATMRMNINRIVIDAEREATDGI